MSSSKRLLLSVDPSLTASGWALFEVRTGRVLAVGVIYPPGTEHYLSRRMSALQNSVLELFEKLALREKDFLVCEGPAPLVKNPQSALKVEGVRGVFEAVARNRGVLVPGRINPRTVQSEILGMRGRQLERKVVKEWSRHTAYQLYEKPLRLMFDAKNGALPKISQDIIDALLIGTAAVSRIQLSLRAKTSVEGAFISSTRTNKGSARRMSTWTEKQLRTRLIGNE